MRRQSQRNSYTGFHISGVAASVLCLIKVLFGLAAAYLLYQAGSLIVRGIQSSGITVSSLQEWLDYCVRSIQSELELLIGRNDTYNQFTAAMNQGALALLLEVIEAVLFLVAFPIIMIVEAIAAIRLRVSGKGTGAIAVIHGVYAASALVTIIYMLYNLFEVWVLADKLQNQLVRSDVKIGTTIMLGVCIVLAFMAFCYQKDIVQAMRYIRRVEMGDAVQLPKNHLSGLSVFFGIGLSLMAAGVILICKDNLGGTYNTTVLILLMVFSAAMAVQPFMVMICNHNMKVYDRSRG